VGLQEQLYGASEYRNDFHVGAGVPVNTYQKQVTKFTDGSENGYSVSDFSWTAGYLTPVISVGAALPLGGWELKPRLDLGFGFNFGGNGTSANQNTGTGSYVYESYRTANGVDIARTKTEYTANRLTLNPMFSLGADLDLAPNIGPSLTVDGGFYLRGDDYGVTNKTTTYIDPTQTQVLETKNAFSEYSAFEFVVKPAYRYALSLGDKVDLGLKGGLDVTISNGLSKPDTSTVTTQKYTYPNPAGNYTQTARVYNAGNKEEESSWGIAPQAAAAVQFNAIPSRLTLNAGVGLTLPGFSTTETKITPFQSKTVEEIERADGTKTEYVSATGLAGDSTSATTNVWTNFNWGFGAGFSFLFNETFGVDLAFAGTNFNNVNISNLSVLFTVRR
jgi:hypothetical protein